MNLEGGLFVSLLLTTTFAKVFIFRGQRLKIQKRKKKNERLYHDIIERKTVKIEQLTSFCTTIKLGTILYRHATSDIKIMILGKVYLYSYVVLISTVAVKWRKTQGQVATFAGEKGLRTGLGV